MNWIYLAVDSVLWRDFVNTVLTIWIPYKTGNLLTTCAITSFSTRDIFQAVGTLSLLRHIKATPGTQQSRNCNQVSMNGFPVHTKWSDSIDFPLQCVTLHCRRRAVTAHALSIAYLAQLYILQ